MNIGPELVLGTATFGTNYGIANKGKVLEPGEVQKIIVMASELGINHFDSAPAYGEAEKLIGDFWPAEKERKITSKISKEDSNDINRMVESVKETLKKTHSSKLWAVLLHDPDALTGPFANKTKEAFLELQKTGLVERIGVSTYSAKQALKAKELFPDLSVFQIPENICDQRNLKSPELMDLAKKSNSIFVRSVFLQGLLLMNLDSIPKKLSGAKKSLESLKRLTKKESISPLELCMAYALALPWASGVLIGVSESDQLKEIARSRMNLKSDWASKIETLDDWHLDPRNWS